MRNHIKIDDVEERDFDVLITGSIRAPMMDITIRIDFRATVDLNKLSALVAKAANARPRLQIDDGCVHMSIERTTPETYQ